MISYLSKITQLLALCLTCLSFPSLLTTFTDTPRHQAQLALQMAKNTTSPKSSQLPSFSSRQDHTYFHQFSEIRNEN